MCRLIAYKGKSISLNKLLYEPSNSLVTQSYMAKELEEPLNGDGFGIGWYAKEHHEEPVVFVSVYPAWNNRNLRSLAPKVFAQSIVAHVRAASVGDVSESNCHPFQFRNLLMMHNGGVEDFSKIKRRIRENLPDELYLWVKGQTDSEHLFALFLKHLLANNQELNADTIANALQLMVNDLKVFISDAEITEEAYLNMLVTDGDRMVGMRYVSNPKVEPLTLYVSQGKKYECNNGVCQMIEAAGENKSVIIVSEKLTDIAEDWTPVPKNHMVLVYKDLSVKFKKVE